MDNKNNIQDELKDMQSGLPVKNSQPFYVPEGYFEGLASLVMANIKGATQSAADELKELSPMLASIPKELPYQVPAGYFNGSLSVVPLLVSEEASTVLQAIGRTVPYSVPQDYFKQLPNQLLEKVSVPTAKVVPLFSRNWMRAAVAAAIGGVLLIGGYQYVHRDGEMETALEQPADTTARALAKNEHSIMQDIKKLSTKELEEFIKTVPVNTTSSSQPSTLSAKVEVTDWLKDVPVKEIDNFLEQLPTADDDLAGTY